MSAAITEAQLRYIKWLAKKVECPIPYPECLSDDEARWLIRDLRMKVGEHRANQLIRDRRYPYKNWK